MLEKIKEAGIVGAGGAGFPTHVKLSSDAEYVLVNGAECEPLLRVDQELMAHFAKELVEGLKLAMQTVHAKKGIICLKSKYKKAIEALKIVQEEDNIEIKTLRNVYPAGDEQYIVYNAIGKIVPEAGIPLDVGAVVMNVETLINVYHASLGQAVTHKYVTIAGAVHTPKTFYVPVGTALKDLIDACGGPSVESFRVIDGGPMMGKLLEAYEVFVKKTSKGYIILPDDAHLVQSKAKSLHQIVKEAKTSCCHCNLCTEICPRNLLGHNLHPAKLMRIASYGSLGEKSASLDQAYLCCECGLCEIACIMNLQPWKLNQDLKVKLKEQGIKNSHHNKDLQADPFYDYRGYPVKKLISRLDLRAYDLPAPIVEEVPNSGLYRIYASQHIGAPGSCEVKVGQKVELGTLLYSIPEKSLGANIHSSVAGIVENITEGYIEIRV